MTTTTVPDHDVRLRSGLLQRVLNALLREDHLGIQSSGALVADPSLPPGMWWRAPLPGARQVAMAVRPDGFLADHAVAEAVLVLDGPDGRRIVTGLDEALAALAPVDDADARAGWADLADECAQTLPALRMDALAHVELYAGIAAEGPATGFAGLLQYEAVAALRDHPVYPTGRCRWDLDEAELRRYAPEFRPGFALHWVVVPRVELRLSPALVAGGLPRWWPTPSQLGTAPGCDADHLAVPVHPLTAGRGLPILAPGRPRPPMCDADHLALPVHPVTAERSLPAVAPGRPHTPTRAHADPDSRALAPRLAGPFGPVVTPTLSMRTLAVLGEPGLHLKVPLPTATLGRCNRRTIKPGTLGDGDTVHRLLAAILAREPRLARRVLLADESHWIDSPDELLAVLLRRYPAEVTADRLVPLAALLAPDPHGAGTVLDGLAAGDVPAWFDRYFEVLLDWHLALWLRYGIALESHQQNITVAQGTSLRLVYKDDDGARIDCARLASALGPDAPLPVRPEAFHDRRMAVSDPVELADMVVTITLHLCVGALVVEHAGSDADRRAQLFTLARARLDEAARRWTDPADAGSVAAAVLLCSHVIDADRWPVKAMLTAGTLLPKHRLGCTDVNKHYVRSGPNYLRAPRADREIRSRS